MKKLNFTEWMKEATDPQKNISFLSEATLPFRGARQLDATKVIHGIGRGHRLLRNAEKWTRPPCALRMDSLLHPREIGPSSMKRELHRKGFRKYFSAGTVNVPPARYIPDQYRSKPSNQV